MRRLRALFLLASLLCLFLSACSTAGEARLVPSATPDASASPNDVTTPAASPSGGDDQSDEQLRCSGTQIARYQPGLKDQGQSVTISASATYGSCTSSLDPADPITGGTSSYRITDTDRSCKGGHSPSTILETYQWVSAQGRTLSSQVTYTRTDLQVVPDKVQITSTGSVQTGAGAGDQVQRILTLTDQDPAACQSTSGLQSTAGSVTLVFTKSTT